MYESFLQTLKIVPSGVLIINNETGEVNFANTALREILSFNND